MNVFVTTGKYADKKTGEQKTLVGFGSLNEYEGQKPNAKDVFYKISEIDTFLKAVKADKIPVNMSVKNEAGENIFMKADAYYQTGISKEGIAYGFSKIAIELQPEKRSETGELIQNAEKLYATKGKDGYSFDKNSDMELVAKFNKLISEGVEFTLSATKNDTLAKYPKLMEAINQIDKSAKFEIDFEKNRGAFIKSVQSPAIKTNSTEAEIASGEKMIIAQASQEQER
nr:hypothetical protein [uncultured Campylobacter sp.]